MTELGGRLKLLNVAQEVASHSIVSIAIMLWNNLVAQFAK